MNTLKTINKNILWILIVLVTFLSCTDLELENEDSVLTESFPGLLDPASTVDDLYATLAGQYGDQANYFALTEVTTDEQLIPTRGTDWGDNGRWRVLHTHEWGLEEGDIKTPFGQFNTNQLKASQVLASPDILEVTMAEASFIRAYSMWIILDLYGQIPFRDVALPSSAIPEVLSGQEAVDFIISDLDNAISGLPLVNAGGETGRASKSAARFLKAKVLLNKHVYISQLEAQTSSVQSSDMDMVISLVDEISAEGYALEQNYFDIFRDTPDTETILSFVSATGNRIYNGLHYNSTNLGGGGWNGFSTLAEFYDLFEGDANTNRLDVNGNPIDGQEDRRGGVPSMGIPAGLDGTKDSNPTDGFVDGSNVGTGFLIGQQYNIDGTQINDRSGNPSVFGRDFIDGSGNASLTGNNEVTGIRLIKYRPIYNEGFTGHEVIFRYADAHLMKAEAIMRGGSASVSALSLVNELRQARNNNGNTPPLSTLTEQELLDERGRELYIETWRRNDLIRFNQFTRSWLFKPSDKVGDRTYRLFPIPVAQVLSNPNLVQNPGY